MDRIVNLELLLQPMNWIIVILMLAIAVFGIHLLTASVDEIGAATVSVVR